MGFAAPSRPTSTAERLPHLTSFGRDFSPAERAIFLVNSILPKSLTPTPIVDSSEVASPIECTSNAAPCWVLEELSAVDVGRRDAGWGTWYISAVGTSLSSPCCLTRLGSARGKCRFKFRALGSCGGGNLEPLERRRRCMKGHAQLHSKQKIL